MQLREYILTIENKILSELLFVPGSTFFPRVQEHGVYKLPTTNPAKTLSAATVTPEDVKNGMKRTANTIVLTTTLKKFSRLAEQKAQELCHHLWTCSDISSIVPDASISTELENALQRAVSAMVNALMYRHLDLMYNRNLTVIVIGIVCCTAKICGFKVKFPAVMKVATRYFNEDAYSLNDVSLDALLSMKWAEKKKKNEMNNGSGIDGDDDGGESSESDEDGAGWSSSSSDDEYNDKDTTGKQNISGIVGSAREVS